MEFLLHLRTFEDMKLSPRFAVDGAWLTQRILGRVSKAQDCSIEAVVAQVCQRLVAGKIIVECRPRGEPIAEAKAWRELHPRIIPALKFSATTIPAMVALAEAGVPCCFFNVKTAAQVVLAGKSKAYAIVPSMEIAYPAYNALSNYEFGRNADEEQPGEVSWNTQLWCWLNNTEDFEATIDVAAEAVVLDTKIYQALVKGS